MTKKIVVSDSLEMQMLRRKLKAEDITSLLIEIGRKYKALNPEIQSRREVIDFYEYEDDVILIIFKFYHKDTPDKFRYGALPTEDFALGTVEDTDENFTPNN